MPSGQGDGGGCQRPNQMDHSQLNSLLAEAMELLLEAHRDGDEDALASVSILLRDGPECLMWG